MNAAPSLHRSVLGADFDRLAPELRAFHDLAGTHVLEGRCAVERSPGFVKALIALAMGLPAASPDAALRFTLDANSQRERWCRQFPDRAMRSTLVVADGLLEERVGPVALRFRLEVRDGTLVLHPAGARFLGIPYPSFLAPRIVAAERASPGRLHFDVAVSLPLLGPVVAYKGHLAVNPAP